MQTYANLCILGSLGFYCFTDVGGKVVGKAMKLMALLLLAAFVVTEGIALLT